MYQIQRNDREGKSFDTSNCLFLEAFQVHPLNLFLLLEMRPLDLFFLLEIYFFLLFYLLLNKQPENNRQHGVYLELMPLRSQVSIRLFFHR